MSLRDLSNSLTNQIPFDVNFCPELYNSQLAKMSCTINGLHSIVEDLFHEDISEDLTAAIARSKGLFDLNSGTSSENIDSIAKAIGLKSSTGNYSLDDLLEKIRGGDAVLSHLDPRELHGFEALNPFDKLIGPGHSVRLIGLSPDSPEMLRFADPGASGNFFECSRELFEAASGDTNGLATVIDLPDTFQEKTELLQQIQDSYANLDPEVLNQYSIDRITENVREWHNSFDEYLKPQIAPSGFYGAANAHESSHNLDDHDTLKEAAGIDVGNILATGGYMALVEFYKDNPQKAKRITQIAAAAGAFDAFTEFGDGSVSLDFEINPLLVASMAVYLTRYANFSQGSFGARISAKAATWVNKGMKIAEYGGYAAAAITAVDFLTGLEATEGILEVLNSVDFLGIIPDVADGVDIVEGLATLGLGIAASRLVRYIFKKLGEDKVKEIAHLTKKTAPKKVLAELIAGDAPPELLLGPYIEYRNH